MSDHHSTDIGPTVRLATFDIPAVHDSLSQAPAVRLAVAPRNQNGGNNSVEHNVTLGGLGHPTVRLAHKSAQGDNNLMGIRGVERIPQSIAPALLVSYVYVDGFLKNQHRYCYRDWMMDSGAYSAYNSGKVIDIDEYIEACKRLRASDPTLKEIIGLDVIGSAEGSRKNSFYMKDKGVEIVPVFHFGEDFGLLKDYCAAFDKVGLSCRFGETMEESNWFYDQCFAHGWPKKFHSFGWISETVLMRYPFHSGDSTSWEIGPCAFGNWKSLGKVSVRGSKQNLRAEIEWYLKLEAKLRVKWRKQMLELEGAGHSPTVRVASDPNSGSGKRLIEALAPESPTVRLAAQAKDAAMARRLGGKQ